MTMWIAFEFDKLPNDAVAEFIAKGGKVKMLTDNQQELSALDKAVSARFSHMKSVDCGLISQTTTDQAKAFV